jgi:phage shock protein PspC (stress-responsive transcriptional regulator)
MVIRFPTMIKFVRKFLEKSIFGVCQWWGDKLGIRSSRIRLYFIYLSCITVASPLIAYLVMAFVFEHKDMIKEGFRKKRVWDL